MKRLLLLPVAVLALCLFATPVLAADPPGMDVDISIVTPGDADVGIDVQAGGSSSIIVDGVDFKHVEGMANQAWLRANEPSFTMWDFGYYWERTGLKEYYDQQLAEYYQMLDILAIAQVQLIGATEEGQANIAQVALTLDSLDSNVVSMSSEIASLQGQAEETWNQLMYGAEAHIDILEDRADASDARVTLLLDAIVTLQSRADNMQQELDIVRADNGVLISYTEYLRTQYLYYFWILGGICAGLLVLSVWALLRSRRNG